MLDQAQNGFDDVITEIYLVSAQCVPPRVDEMVETETAFQTFYRDPALASWQTLLPVIVSL